MCQVWRALCKPLNQEVAVKLVNLERQDVDLVRARLGAHEGASRTHTWRGLADEGLDEGACG